MEKTSGPVRSVPRADKNKDDDGRPPKRSISNEKDIPKAQTKILKSAHSATVDGILNEETIENVNITVDEEETQDAEMDEVINPLPPTTPHPEEWHTLQFVGGRLVGLAEVPASVHSDATRREQEILENIGAAHNPNDLKQRVTQLPPTHITPRILNKLLSMMGPLVQCPHCKGSSHTLWEEFGSDGRAKCTTTQKSDMDKDIPCPGRLDATYLWLLCTGQSKTGNTTQLKNIFQRLFSTITKRRAPTAKMNLEAANHKATSRIAALLQNTEEKLNFKEVQITIQAQQTYSKGLEDHIQQLTRAFNQIAHDLQQAQVTSANAHTADGTFRKNDRSYANVATRRPTTKPAQLPPVPQKSAPARSLQVLHEKRRTLRTWPSSCNTSFDYLQNIATNTAKN
ncbi:hypothetical protein BC829DRAFT_417330 [Chytridium lagenaria]|nr:hypothetical protein BC829DRAFT_417330 [Chytridium lagenaria]